MLKSKEITELKKNSLTVVYTQSGKCWRCGESSGYEYFVSNKGFECLGFISGNGKPLCYECFKACKSVDKVFDILKEPFMVFALKINKWRRNARNIK